MEIRPVGKNDISFPMTDTKKSEIRKDMVYDPTKEDTVPKWTLTEDTFELTGGRQMSSKEVEKCITDECEEIKEGEAQDADRKTQINEDLNSSDSKGCCSIIYIK